MRQFDQSAILANRLHSPDLTADSLDPLGSAIARFHATAAVLPAEHALADVHRVLDDAMDNFTALRRLLHQPQALESLDALSRWTGAEYVSIQADLKQRVAQGHVRHCHGDLHCRNIVWFDGHWTPFDGIEFNDALAWIDTMNEIAFLNMDLIARGRVLNVDTTFANRNGS